MKKEVRVTYHLDNLEEFRDIISGIDSKSMYFVYPTFWFDNDSNRSFLSLCLTIEPNCFSDSVTIFPPDCGCSLDLYIQFAALLEYLKTEDDIIFAIHPIDYKDA